MNERITAPKVLLIGADGQSLGERSRDEALRLAREATLDLVEVAPDANPPVCRVLDWGKFKYERTRAKHQGHKHHVSKLKELRLRPMTDAHDIEVRSKQAHKFLERGDKVLVTVKFRGREMAHADLGQKILANFASMLTDVARVESTTRLENRTMTMMLVPHKSSAAPAH